MAANTAVLTGRNGILRIVTVIFGIITFSLVSNVYVPKYGKEEFLLGITVTACILSIIWVLLSLMEAFKPSDETKKTDTGFHLIAGLLILIASILWLVSVFDWGDLWCGGYTVDFTTGKVKGSCRDSTSFIYIKRILAGVLGIIDSMLYLGLGFLLFKS